MADPGTLQARCWQTGLHLSPPQSSQHNLWVWLDTHKCQLQPDLMAELRAERERILAAAKEAAFTLFRPGNGPAQGQSMEVVPLEALRAALERQQP